MDLVTLWDRVNDAVNTIIRREDSAETGDLLPPCVEGINYSFIFKIFVFESNSEILQLGCFHLGSR